MLGPRFGIFTFSLMGGLHVLKPKTPDQIQLEYVSLVLLKRINVVFRETTATGSVCFERPTVYCRKRLFFVLRVFRPDQTRQRNSVIVRDDHG